MTTKSSTSVKPFSSTPRLAALGAQRRDAMMLPILDLAYRQVIQQPELVPSNKCTIAQLQNQQ